MEASQFQWLLVLCVAVSSCLPVAVGEKYTVGGPAGWTIPSRSNVNYTQWAGEQRFKVGDVLVFKYVYRAHSVLEVRRSDFRYCNTTDPLVAHDDKSGTTEVTLANPGNYYFIDGVGNHCLQGQKFQARVLPAGAGGAAPEAYAPAPEPSSAFAVPPAAGSAHALSTTSSSSLLLALFATLSACLLAFSLGF